MSQVFRLKKGGATVLMALLLMLVVSTNVLAQDKLIRVTDESTQWRKNNSQVVLNDHEKARLLMPPGAAFGVECVPSFSPEWTLTYDSVACALVYKEAQTSIWNTTYRAMHKKKKVGKKHYKWIPRKHPKGYVAPDVKTFTLPVSHDQAAMLRAIWKVAVCNAEDRKVYLLDGVKWEYFIDHRRAKSHRSKNVLVAFTEQLREAVGSGDARRKDSLISNEFQHVVDGLTIAPPPEVLPPGTVRTLIVCNGEVLNDSLAVFHTIGRDDQVYFYRRQQMVKRVSFHRDEDKIQEFAEKYGITAKDLVMEFETVPDTLCDAYVRQHPQLMAMRRYVEGCVVGEEGQPLADAWVYVYGKSRMGTGAATDSTGHFAFWLSPTDTLLGADHNDYKWARSIPITDNPVIIRLERRGRMKMIGGK